jgi:hypothetical protein
MSQKLKIILGALIVIAVFVLYKVGLFVHNSTRATANITTSTAQTDTTLDPSSDPCKRDSDHDGLSDCDEIVYGTNPFNPDTDGDGYFDGEEVATGYGPLDPDSNPKTGKKSTIPTAANPNLTDRVLNLSVASLVNDSGQIDPTQATDQKQADILQSVNNDATLMFLIPPLTDADIKISDDNSPGAIGKYLNSITAIIEENLFSSITNVTSGVNDITGSNSTYPDYYQKAYDSLKVIEVPSSWKELHKATLLDFLQLANSFKAMRDLNEDPVKASFALTKIQDSFLQLLNLLNQASNLAKSQNVSTQDSILQLIQSAGGILPSAK